MLEETKQRQRLQQEARTIAKLEQLEIEICEKLSGELECVYQTQILLGSIHSVRVTTRKTS